MFPYLPYATQDPNLQVIFSELILQFSFILRIWSLEFCTDKPGPFHSILTQTRLSIFTTGTSPRLGLVISELLQWTLKCMLSSSNFIINYSHSVYGKASTSWIRWPHSSGCRITTTSTQRTPHLCKILSGSMQSIRLYQQLRLSNWELLRTSRPRTHSRDKPSILLVWSSQIDSLSYSPSRYFVAWHWSSLQLHWYEQKRFPT